MPKKWEKTPNSTEPGSYFIDDWNKRHLEVYFPSQHTPHLPWKACGQGEVKDEVVRTLCHVTHKKEFDEIKSSKSYTLKFNKKKGKSGYKKEDGSPLGFTFVAPNDIKMPPDERSEYKYVDSSTGLLPGSYLWWSIDNNIQNEPHKSIYGSVAICGHIEHLLKHYQASFPRDPLTGKLPKIELRIGGTLRYKFEICYVIIVCKEKEPTLPYDKYPVWSEGRKIHFDMKDAVLFIDPIKVKNIKGARCNNYSWSHHVFGFHFPDDLHQMICPKSCFKEKETIHNDTCIRSRPRVPGDKTWVCPDKIANNSQNKRKMSNDTLDDERESKRQRCDDEEM